MTLTDDVRALRGRTLVDRDGQDVGKVEEIYLDEQTRRPEWAAVKTGILGGSSLVPLTGASEEGDKLRVQFSKDQIKDAPGVSADQDISEQEEAELARHYGLEYSEARSDSGLPEGEGAGGQAGRDDAMTLSEEQLRTGVERRPAGRARMRKWVETETETQTVPVQRETARVEREPITEENVNQARSGPEISEAEREVTLEEERPVVEKEAVPKERVRLDKDVVTEEEQVSGEVRKERVDVEDDAERTS